MPRLDPRATMAASLFTVNNTSIGVGFGTAALGNHCYNVVTMALQEGFSKFDTAEENDHWYDSASVGQALADYFLVPNDECVYNEDTMAEGVCGRTCSRADLRISTKIPPWKLTSEENIRKSAEESRNELVGFCEEILWDDGNDKLMIPFPLDVYYIHAPTCWKGWHPRCENPPPLMDLQSAWLAMEAVAAIDHSAKRIGISNVSPNELLSLIDFIRKRQETVQGNPPPRLPDVLQAFADPIEPADELRRICRQHNIEFVSYSTLGTQHARRGGKNPVLDSPIIRNIAERLKRSTAEIVLSWALQKNMSVIPRSSEREHIAQLARLLRKDESTFLNEDDMSRIDSMRRI
ncbi:hypothetical protein MPSEU_000895700 [Mayamaea pseudoterrestris]|nr:hypothetical protein MPSEU_000895700 [Mayamaea pseudoterrestris]